MRWPWQPRWIEIGGEHYRWVFCRLSWVLANEAGEEVGEAIGRHAYLEKPTQRIGSYIDSHHARRAVERALLERKTKR